MKQFEFEFESVDQACAGVSDIQGVLDSPSHKDAMAFVFVGSLPEKGVERLASMYDACLPEVKRVGISEGYAADFRTVRTFIKFNLVLAECGEVFHPVQIPCSPGCEEAAAAEMSRFLDAIPFVKGVAFYPSGLGINITRFLRAVKSQVPFFGAMAIPQYESEQMLSNGILEDGYGIGSEIISSGFTAMAIAGKHVSSQWLTPMMP